MRPSVESILVIVCLLAVSAVSAPGPASAQQAAAAPDALRVFLDCESFLCDQDFVRREISWVDWVRERRDADVHVLVTTQQTGGGGLLYELTVLGRGDLAGRADTLTASLPAASTDDAARRALVRKLALGLAGHAAETPAGARLRVVLDDDADSGDGDGTGAGATMPADDPWNLWVFSVRAGGFFNGESRQQFRNFNGSLSARRITDEWKFTLRVNGSYNLREFELTDETATSIRRSYGANLLLARSMGPHWSTGILVRASSASAVNQDLTVRPAPAVEFNVFPYDESSRRQLVFRYSVGPSYLDYAEETVYGRRTERLVEHQLSGAIELEQPWGSVSTALELSHYPAWAPGPGAIEELSDGGTKYRASLNAGIDLNLVRGLSLDLNGNYQRINDQVYLSREGASDQDVLLRIRRLQTNYRYFGTIGLRYTFGSIFNNVVNPRFDGTASGGIVFMR